MNTLDHQALAHKRIAYVQLLEFTLKRIVNLLASMPEVRQAILFGSYAEGRTDNLTCENLIYLHERQEILFLHML